MPVGGGFSRIAGQAVQHGFMLGLADHMKSLLAAAYCCNHGDVFVNT